MKTKQEISEYKKSWYLKNRDKQLLKHKTNYEKDRENRLIKAKKYREENKDKIQSNNKKYPWEKSRYKTYFNKLSKYEECRQDPEDLKLLQVKCKYCGIWFNPTNLQSRHRYSAIIGESTGEHNFYCSTACKQSCPTYWEKNISRWI